MNLEYGIRREVANNAPAYNPLNLTFICSGELKEKRLLDQWNNLIVDSTNGFDVAYYDTYAKRWDPYKTIACLHLWHFIES